MFSGSTKNKKKRKKKEKKNGQEKEILKISSPING